MEYGQHWHLEKFGYTVLDFMRYGATGEGYF